MLKLLFFAPKQSDPQFQEIMGGHIWKLLKIWQSVAPPEIEIDIRPSAKIHYFNKYVFKKFKKRHPLIMRHRTILEINNQHIFIDASDHHSVGSRAAHLKEIFKYVIKFQPQKLGNYVLPFTYFTELNNDLLMKYREQRKEILKNRDFQYSIIWTGTHLGNTTPIRAKMSKYLKANCKMAKVGPCDTIEEYLNLTSKSLVGVTGSRNGQFSRRDMDFFAIGTPFFCKNFNIRTHNPLIPNKHYYSIGGDEVGISKTLEYFVSYFEPNGKIKEFSDQEWNEYINMSNTSMDWFDKNASPLGSLNLLIQILKKRKVI